jgi:FAD/FMN-containing dehydrogenase
MKAKKRIIKSFGNNLSMIASVYRPERQREASNIPVQTQRKSLHYLPIGNQLSYGDICLNERVATSEKLNRFIDYDPNALQITVEPGVTFKNLLELDNKIIPPVIPGTLHATLAGGVANDIHGKNQTKQGCFGHHINWLELALPNGCITVSPTSNSDLFYATIGGLGLTGYIRKINLNLQKNTHTIKVRKQYFVNINQGIRKLTAQVESNDYSAAWFDLYRNGRGVLFQGTHTLGASNPPSKHTLTFPFTFPFSCINKLTMKHFNNLYYRATMKKPTRDKQTLITFNNPLDNVKNWNRLYGKKGLFQFQCVIPTEHATDFSKILLDVIQKFSASPSLAVMKSFGQTGLGLLSFAKPGITFAIDFPSTTNNRNCIEYLNQLLLDFDGRVYLAKDQLLNTEQFQKMYPNYLQFIEILNKYEIYASCQSQLSRRLGIHNEI